MADPYWIRFCTPLATRILALIAGRTTTGPSGTTVGDYILEERIAAVLGDGHYEVGGDTLQTKGRAQLAVGQTVHVLWRGNRRHLILTHQWQRAQGGPRPQPPGGGPIVEELWFVGADVWFRNADIAASLDIQRFSLPGTIIDLGWGPRADRFFIHHRTRTGSPAVDNHYVSVFTVAREPDGPLPTGTEPADAIALERTYALAPDGHLVAHLVVNSAIDGSSVTQDLFISDVGRPQKTFGATASTCSVTLSSNHISDDGHAIVVLTVSASLLSANSAIVPDSSPPIRVTTNWSPSYPIVIDLETHAHLLDTFVDGAAAFGPDAGDLVFNTFPWVGWPVVNEADLPFPLTYATHPENDQLQQFQVAAPLVVGGELIRWIGTSDRRRDRTSYSAADGYPSVYTPLHRTLLVQPPPPTVGLLVLVPGSALYGFNAPRFDINETHILWHIIVDSVFRSRITPFVDGVTADAGLYVERFLNRNVRMLATSYAWQPERAQVTQPEADRNRFLALWDFATGAVLVDPATSAVDEDTALESIKTLAPLPPEAPAQPTGPGGLAIHVINREEILAPLDRYRPHVGPPAPVRT